ncbi:MAG: choice-of-anchor J domain-containing protein [Lachnospiraceae bacterium]|nr:choice-of-anchor J domain-containing protein [Lachnospiraceae bacterium]
MKIKIRKSYILLLAIALTISFTGLEAQAAGPNPAGTGTTALTSLREGFEGGVIPEGWTLETDDSYYQWRVGTGDYESFMGAYSGNYNAMITHGYYNNSKGWLISPMLDLSSVPNIPSLSFAYMNRRWGSSVDEFGVYWRVNGGTWQELFYVTKVHDQWTTQTVYLPNAARKKNVQIGFVALDWYGRGVALDDVVLLANEQYSVMISNTLTYGKITADKEYAEAGNIVTLTIAPDGIRELDSLNVKCGNERITVKKTSETQYNFVMPEGNVTVDAKFELPKGLSFYEDFEDGHVPEGWSLEDWDGDGQTWYVLASNQTLDKNGNTYYHSETQALTSASYNNEALHPNNWAVSPAISIPPKAKLSFWIKADDPEYPNEKMAVYVGTTNNVKAMRKVGGDYTATPTYVRYEVDLASYAGQTVYLGFRHYDSTDMYRLNLDDVAIMAEVSEEPLTDERLTISKKSLTLYDTIAIDFKVPVAAMEAYHDPYLLVTQNNEKGTITDYRVEGDLMIFTYRVVPQMMDDAVTAVPHALNAYDEDVTGVALTYSVTDYCYNMLNKEQYQKPEYASLRRLLVDILLYGSAAQQYVNYKTDALASSRLTAAQLAMGTDVTKEMTYENVKLKDFAVVDEEDAMASIEKATLYLEAAVNVRFKFTAGDLTGLRVVITDDEAGTNVIGELAAKQELIDGNGLYYVTFGALNAGQMRKTIYATAMLGRKKVSNTYRYSIESYVASMKGKGDKKLDNLLDAMMRYGDSAKAFVNGN